MKLMEVFGIKTKQEIYYYNTKKDFYPQLFAAKLRLFVQEERKKGKQGVVFLCIGTDRSTGDSLGPLIGHKLIHSEFGRKQNVTVLGTLEHPVHAMNLEQYKVFVENNYPDHIVIAVDASVGNTEHVGYITLGQGSLKPGLGVSKDLKAVGDIFITGIVGGCKSFDPVMLQSIRLSVVMHMADCISQSIRLVENL